ncbi:MAG TPA: hypothetical protein EYN38_05235 [Flavobacteriales bacterium]|nr:hypothetical protein [Flavobacteriales bacterium]HIO72493.1 hypothetical protein [Flavobacteriales bacterium]
MGYIFLKYLSRFIISFYYRVNYRKLPKFPNDVPVVIVANHTNAFLDSLIIGGRIAQKMYSLPRGTIFFNQPKFVLIIFSWARMIPVFRQMEGDEYVKRNLESFNFLKEALGRKESLQIFPEAICIQERRLKPAKKGAAKIMLGAEKKYGYELNTQVVFLGMNYKHAPSFDSTLLLNYSRPYDIKQFCKLYQEHEGRGIKALTEFIGERLKNQVIHIDDQSLDELVEQAELVYKPHLFQQYGLDMRSSRHHFIVSRELAKAVNYFHKLEDDRLASVKKKLSDYVRQIDELGIKDHWLARKVYLPGILLRIVLLVFALPLHVYGLLTNLVPAGIPKFLAEKVVKKDEFYSSVVVLAAMTTYLVVIPLYMIIVSQIYNSLLIGFLFIVSVILFGKFSTHYFSWQKICWEMICALRVKGKEREKLANLLKLRADIVDNLSELKESFRKRHKS